MRLDGPDLAANKLAYLQNGTVIKEKDETSAQGFKHRVATVDGTNPVPPICTGAPPAASFNNLVPR